MQVKRWLTLGLLLPDFSFSSSPGSWSWLMGGGAEGGVNICEVCDATFLVPVVLSGTRVQKCDVKVWARRAVVGLCAASVHTSHSSGGAHDRVTMWWHRGATVGGSSVMLHVLIHRRPYGWGVRRVGKLLLSPGGLVVNVILPRWNP